MEKFTTDSVVADMHLDGVPNIQLKVTYDGVEVTPGVVLTPTQVQNPPSIQFDAESDSYYTLVMNDPDAPSRKDPKFREWHHWLVVNIPGGDVTKGEVKSDYIGAGPPKGTGLHRYVLLMYKQPGKIDFSKLPKMTRCTDGRGGQKIGEFVKKWGLKELVAGNYFQAEWDDYVPKLYEDLKQGKK